MLFRRASRRFIFTRLLAALGMALVITVALAAAEPAKKRFDIPAGDAETALRQFSQQAGVELVFSIEKVTGVRTNAAIGDYTPREAIEQMVAGTDLTVVQDEKTEALAVRRKDLPPPAQSKAADPAEPKAAPLTAPKASRATDSASENEVIKMNRFIVTAEEDTGYRATSTLAGTRIKTDLRDVGSAVSVVTEQFLRDTGATNNESLLVYTPGTEIGGTTGNFSAVPPDRSPNETPTLIRPNTNNRVRGLSSADNTRDFYLTDIPWDSYNTGRIDLQRGPNSILFGLGNPSGIINAGLNPASFKDSNKIEARFDGYGSYRGSVDFNRVLLENELAIRVSALDDETYYQEKPAYNRDKRLYGALRYEPAFLSKAGAHTSLRLNVEAGDIDANRPRTLPPIDRITRWFKTGTYTVPANPATGQPQMTYPNLNRSVYDIFDAYNYRYNVPGSTGVTQKYIYAPTYMFNPNFQPGISEIYTSGVYMFFPDSTSSAQGHPATIIAQSNSTTLFGIGPNGNRDATVTGIPYARMMGLTEPWKLAQYEGRPFYAQYRDPSLTDPSVFDFYHQLLDGPNKLATRDFVAVNAALDQSFLDNRLGFQVAYDKQKYRDGQDALLKERNQMITIDINATLPDGSPNPNVGRPELVGQTQDSNFGMRTEREEFRITGFADLRSEDFLGKSFLTSLLGHHTFTGLYSRNRYDRENLSWARFLLDQGYSQLVGSPLASLMDVVMYLGPDLRNVTSSSGLHLPAPTAVDSPTTTTVRYFDSHWNKPTNPAVAGYVDPSAVWVDPFTQSNSTQSENPANYVGWTTYNAQVLNSLAGDRHSMITSAGKNRYKLESKAFVWQGFFWDGVIVPTFGYRKDTNKTYTVNAPFTNTGIAIVDSPAYAFSSTPRSVLQTQTRSWSVVIHTPAFIQRKLPYGTNLSLTYNKANNFNPADVGRTDMLGRSLAPSEGQTKDLGVILSTLDDRLSLRITWYKTAVSNSSYPWSGAFWVGSEESRLWVSAKRYQAGLTGDPLYSGPGFNFGDMVGGVFVQTAADRAAQQAAVNAALAAVPTNLFIAWQIPTTDAKWQDPPHYDASAPWGQAPAGYTATRDTESKGTEYELSFNPTKNWSIAFNGSKMSAVTTNNIGDLSAWIETRNAIWQGPAGDMPLFVGLPSSIKLRDDWNNNVWGPYQYQKYLNGTKVPELGKWRFNLVTNYGFDQGRLKGFNVGGAYRWLDKQALGYPWIRGTINNTPTDIPDVAHPIYGPTDGTVDLWVGYQRKLTDKVTWRIQLNVRNAFGRNELIPVSVNPDGSICSYRIKEGRSWAVTNTLSF